MKPVDPTQLEHGNGRLDRPDQSPGRRLSGERACGFVEIAPSGSRRFETAGLYCYDGNRFDATIRFKEKLAWAFNEGIVPNESHTLLASNRFGEARRLAGVRVRSRW